MSERQAGWYWCQKRGEHLPCRWTGDRWVVPGYAAGESPGAIGTRIPTPDEPWQMVPVELIDWIRGAQELMREIPDSGWRCAANQADILLAAAPKP